jgi:hypothetical protein
MNTSSCAVRDIGERGWWPPHQGRGSGGARERIGSGGAREIRGKGMARV